MASLPLFVASVVGISVTGVMMPGPVTAVTITKGSRRRDAGALIAVGHAAIELPLIALIYFGFARFLILPEVNIALSLAGGLVLIWLGLQMLKARAAAFYEAKEPPRGCIVAGLATTAANPYFFLWWATVGAALLASARAFGIWGIVLLVLVHWLCDLGWLYFLSLASFKSRRLWTEKVHRIVFSVCAAVLGGFGAWFIFSGIKLAVAA